MFRRDCPLSRRRCITRSRSTMGPRTRYSRPATPSLFSYADGAVSVGDPRTKHAPLQRWRDLVGRTEIAGATRRKGPACHSRVDVRSQTLGELATADTYRLAQDVEWRRDARVSFPAPPPRHLDSTAEYSCSSMVGRLPRAYLALACVPVFPSLETMANPFTRLLCRYCRRLACVGV